MTWRFGILKDLHEHGLRGQLPLYIDAFMKERYFRVKVGNSFSPIKTQENGVPQGAVLSVILFAVKINSLASAVPRSDNIISSLYVDDFQLGIRHPDLNTAKETMQVCLDHVNEWAGTNGFKFSETKTQAVLFSKTSRTQVYIPPLKMGNVILPYKDTVRFLGLDLDSKLT